MLYKGSEISVDAFRESQFSLDGGAMFGIIPHALWSREIVPDSKNRINLAANILVIKHPDYTALIEQGMGDKWEDKMISRLDLRREKTQVEYLAERGLNPSDITHVILTHLHFDHCGGCTIFDTQGEAIPTFPNAKYYVQEAQLDEALHPHERNTGSFIANTFMPVIESGQMVTLDGDSEILPGITGIVTGGHAAGHQAIELDFDDFKGVYVGDLVPTAHHIDLPWIMSYDLFPTETLEMKKKLLPRWHEENRMILFPHESRFFGGNIDVNEKGKYVIVPAES